MRPWSLGSLAIATIIIALLALNAVLLWRKSGTADQAGKGFRATLPDTERAAQPDLSPPPAGPPRAEGIPERSQSAGVASQPERSVEVNPQAQSGLRGSEPGPSQPESAGLPEQTPAHGSGSEEPPSSPAPAAAPGPSTAPEAAVVPRLAPPDQVPLAPVLRSAAPTSQPAASQPPAAVSSKGADAPAAAGTVSPEKGAVPGTETPADGEGGSDHTPPVLAALRFDPPLVEGGGVTTFTVQASDDLSGVKLIKGEIRSPNGLALLPFLLQDAGGGLFTAAIAIPPGAENGVWYVSWISLIDGANNALLLQAPSAAEAPPGGTFSVHSEQSDSTPPEVLRIWFDKPVVGAGEQNVIMVEARDDLSGVASMMGACQSPSKSALIWFTGTLNVESGIWEGNVSIPANADCGAWTVQQLGVKDKAGNTSLLIGNSPLLARVGFQVSSGADCDFTPPTMDSFDLSPTVVSSETATEILVTARIYDAESGAVSMTGWFEGPPSEGGQVPKNYFHCSPDPNDPTAPWTGKVLVPQLAAKGIWKVGVIRLQDKALNFREYTSADPVVSGHFFEVR